MSLTLNASRRTVQSTKSPRSTCIWITDELLSSAFLRFTICCRRKAQRRHGSNVPGPLEARRRLAKRRMNCLSVRDDVTIEPPLSPPGPLSSPPRSNLGLEWLSGLWKSEPLPSWSYQPPSASHTLPLPVWLNYDPSQTQLDNSSADMGASADTHHSTSTEAEPLHDHIAVLQRRASALLTNIENDLGAVRESIDGSCRRRLLSLVFQHTMASYPTDDDVDRAVDRFVAISAAIRKQEGDVVLSELKLLAYSTVWAALQAQQQPNHLGMTQLYRYLFDRIAACVPSKQSRNLLIAMIAQLDTYAKLQLSSWTGHVTSHILRPDSNPHTDALMTVERLSGALATVSRTRAEEWIRNTVESLHVYFEGHLRPLGRSSFIGVLERIRMVMESVQHTPPDLVRELELVHQRLREPQNDVVELARHTDAGICARLSDHWSLQSDALVPGGLDQHDYPARAPDDVPNKRFQHLALFFELIWASRENSSLYGKCINTILSVLLEQNRPEEFAYVAERVHRSLTFSLPIPHGQIKRWMDIYSAAYPKTAIRLSKLLTAPEFNVSDVLLDLIKAPAVATGALDFFTWREVCKDRLTYLQYLDPGQRQQRCLSPQFAKVMHVLALAYARESRFSYRARFSRIYRLYKHLKLQKAEIHSLMHKLLTLTGVILPLIQGKAMEGGRVQFAIRVGQVLEPQMPVRKDLLQLGRLHPRTRRAHVERWADDTYGPDWRYLVGLAERKQAQPS